MAFSIKSKLFAGVTFLFTVILIIGVMAIIFINRLSADSNDILKDNYQTLLYGNNMLESLEKMPTDKQALNDFEFNLKKQQENVTEPGEAQATQQLQYYFDQVKKNLTDTAYYDNVRKEIYYINELNQKAIERKNQKARDTSKTATTWIAIVGMILFLAAFSFIVNFPGYIANPVKLLNEGIKEIAKKNYNKRIYIESSDEFGELAEAFNQMAQKLDEYEHSNLSGLLFEKKRIETIIGQMNDAIIGLDAKKNILFVNSIAESLLNIRASDVVGKYSADVALKNDLLRNLLVKEEKNNLLKIVLDGKENFFSKDYKNVMNHEEIIGEVIVLRNITHFKELDFAKTNFIATVSHELKTPISSIKAGLQLLQDNRIGETNEEQKQLLDNIREDTDRLLKITSELLNMTQAETGNIQLIIQPSKPRRIIDLALEAIRSAAEQKQIEPEVLCPENTPDVNADTEKTAWVLVNLLSNAIRYTAPGNKVQIEVKADGDTVSFSVQDSGKGIEPKYQSRIFERYFQVPGSPRSGTGLGLSISKDFIEAQGGRIWVESEPGQGSKFTFLLHTPAS